MTITDNKSQNATNRDFSSEKTYNDIPCPEGYLTAPFVVNNKQIVKINQMNTNKFNTWTFGGHPVIVAFTVVPAEEFENMMKVFNIEVNDYLSRYKKMKNTALSLDQFYEDMYDENDEVTGFDPAISESDVEKLFLMASLDELISEVERMDAQCGKVLRLIYANIYISKKEIIEKLGLGKSRGYEVINTAHALAKETYKKLNS